MMGMSVHIAHVPDPADVGNPKHKHAMADGVPWSVAQWRVAVLTELS